MNNYVLPVESVLNPKEEFFKQKFSLLNRAAKRKYKTWQRYALIKQKYSAKTSLHPTQPAPLEDLENE
jgi:hypothetical protein